MTIYLISVCIGPVNTRGSERVININPYKYKTISLPLLNATDDSVFRMPLAV